jgi:hypothetical protein
MRLEWGDRAWRSGFPVDLGLKLLKDDARVTRRRVRDWLRARDQQE